MKKILAAGLIAATVIMMTGKPPTVLANSQPAVQITITPRLCVIDVVQDGSSQTLQSSLQDCNAALPILLSSPADPASRNPSAQKANALFTVPFAGVPIQQTTDASGPFAPPGVDGTLTRIANVDPAQAPTSMPVQTDAVAIAFGATLAVGAIAAGVDIAVFELRYSRRLLATARQCISLLKR